MSYTSRLTVSCAEHLASTLRLGERIPSGEILRHNDWFPLNIQDLLTFDGSFKLLIFPGDITCAKSFEALEIFVCALAAQIAQMDRDASFLKMLVILKNQKAQVHHTVVPKPLRDPTRLARSAVLVRRARRLIVLRVVQGVR